MRTTIIEGDEDSSAPQGTIVAELGDRRLHQRGSVNALVYSPDGRRLASTGINDESTVLLWNAETGELLQELASPAETSGWWYDAIAFSTDGQYLLGGNIRGELDLWDILSGKNLSSEKRHERTIQAVAVSADGHTFATAGEDGWLRVSALEDPEEIVWEKELVPMPKGQGGGDMIGGTSGIGSVVFTPDQRHVLARLNASGSVMVLAAATGDIVREMKGLITPGTGQGFGGGLTSLLVTPDSRRLITGGHRFMRRDDVPQEIVQYSKNIHVPEARVWDLATGEPIRDLTKDRWEVGWGVSALSPDGGLLAQTHDGKLQLLNAANGREIRTFPLPGHASRSLCFSPDGQHLAAAEQHTIAIFEVETGRRLLADQPRTTGGIAAVGYSAGIEPNDDDRKRMDRSGEASRKEMSRLFRPLIVTAGYDARVHFWDAETHEHLSETWLGPQASVREMSFSQHGEYFAVCGGMQDSQGAPQGNVTVWQLVKNKRHAIAMHRVVEGVALSPDSNKLVVVHGNGGMGGTRLELWESIRGYRRVAEFPRDPRKGLSQYKTMRFSPDGRYVLIAEYDGTVTCWDTSAAAEDTRFVADWRDHVQQEKRERDPWIGEAVFTSDGARLVTSTKDTIFVWDLKTQRLLSRIVAPAAKHGFQLCLAPDDVTLAAAERSYVGEPGQNKIRLFDLSTGRPVLNLPLPDDRAISLAFSHDSKTLYSGLSRGTTLVWEVGR